MSTEFDIQEAITKSITDGSSVEKAYRDATQRIFEILINHHTVVELFDLALRRLQLPNDDGIKQFLRMHETIDHQRLYMVVAGGGITNVPSATCMAEHLKGKSKPTREDVEAAMEACRRKP